MSDNKKEEKLRKKQEKAEKKKAESIRPDQSGAKNAPLKTVPSLLERKFADFNYKFAYLIPETVHPNVVTTFGIIAGLLGSVCFFLGTFSKLFFIGAIVGLLIHIVCDHAHSESAADPAHGRTDLSCSHDARGLLIKVDSAQTFQGVVIFTYLVICLVKSAVHGKRKSHCQLCNRLRRITGNSLYHDPQFLGLLSIDIVESGTSHKHTLNTAFLEYLKCLCAHIRTYESTHCIITLGK